MESIFRSFNANPQTMMYNNPVISSILKTPWINFFFFFFFGLWSQSADKLTIHPWLCSWILSANHSTKSTLPFLQDYSICNNARLEFSTNFVPSFDPIEWCLKNGLHSGGSNSQPFSHESSALTTRPRLLP